jgi:hypothetical protein
MTYWNQERVSVSVALEAPVFVNPGVVTVTVSTDGVVAEPEIVAVTV